MATGGSPQDASLIALNDGWNPSLRYDPALPSCGASAAAPAPHDPRQSITRQVYPLVHDDCKDTTGDSAPVRRHACLNKTLRGSTLPRLTPDPSLTLSRASWRRNPKSTTPCRSASSSSLHHLAIANGSAPTPTAPCTCAARLRAYHPMPQRIVVSFSLITV